MGAARRSRRNARQALERFVRAGRAAGPGARARLLAALGADLRARPRDYLRCADARGAGVTRALAWLCDACASARRLRARALARSARRARRQQTVERPLRGGTPPRARDRLARLWQAGARCSASPLADSAAFAAAGAGHVATSWRCSASGRRCCSCCGRCTAASTRCATCVTVRPAAAGSRRPALACARRTRGPHAACSGGAAQARQCRRDARSRCRPARRSRRACGALRTGGPWSGLLPSDARRGIG